MPKKVPLIRIGVQRDGFTMYPTVGKPFDFTKDEIADITRMQDASKADYIRNPVNEDGEPEAKPEAKSAAKAAAGKKDEDKL